MHQQISAALDGRTPGQKLAARAEEQAGDRPAAPDPDLAELRRQVAAAR